MVVIGGIYSLNHYSGHWLTVLSMGTPDSPVVHRHSTIHCPVSATSADCWGFKLLTIEVFYPFATLDSPVRPVIVDCLLTSGTVDCARSRAVDHWAKLVVARCLIGQSGGTPDGPVNFKGRAPRIPESG
jgi:hypothetical protein